MNTSTRELEKYFPLQQAKILNKIIMWQKNSNKYGVEYEGKRYIYNIREDWCDQLGISLSTWKRAIKALRNNGLVDSRCLHTNKRNRTLYYHVDVSLVEEFINAIKAPKKLEESSPVDHFKISTEPMDGCVVYRTEDRTNKSINLVEINKENKEKERNNEKIKPTVVQDCLSEFKKEFPEEFRSIRLNKNLCRYIVAAFKLKFQSNLKELIKFFKKIKTSKYLTSSNFKLRFSWLLKFDTIDRIIDNDFGCIDLKNCVNENCEQDVYSKKLNDSQEELIKEIGIFEYHGWFHNAEWDGNTVYVPSEFDLDCIQNRYLNILNAKNISCCLK